MAKVNWQKRTVWKCEAGRMAYLVKVLGGEWHPADECWVVPPVADWQREQAEEIVAMTGAMLTEREAPKPAPEPVEPLSDVPGAKSYGVKWFRELGFEAQWEKMTNGKPVIVIRLPTGRTDDQRQTWWAVGPEMWKYAGEVGMMRAFDAFASMQAGVPI